MPPKLLLSIFSLLLALTWAKSACAETVVEKVARTGILTVGTRIDLIPYSYVDDKGELVGYSLNILNLLREQMEKDLGREITLQIVEANDVSDRIPKLINGEIDIACDATFTWERDKYVDFSTAYSVSGVKLLVPQNSSLASAESLAGKRIGVVPNTTSQNAIKLFQPQAILVPIASIEDGFKALKEGKIDGLAGDSIVLDGTRQKLAEGGYQLVPNQPYARYGISCMVPENNSTFLNRVNYTIVKFMQGYLIGEAAPVEMVNRWVGSQGIVTIDAKVIQDFFEYHIITHEQIPWEK